MTKQPPAAFKAVGPSAWKRAVAERAGTDLPTVERILAAHSVEAAPVLPRPRNLRIRSVRLHGTKHGTDNDGTLGFEWPDLDEGVFALLTDRNLRGKSSVLAVIRAAVQGRFPGAIKRDVWQWISSLDVRFEIERTCYRVMVTKESGEEGLTSARARLSRMADGPTFDLYDGPLGDDFEEQVAALFGTELGIEPFFAYNAKTGLPTRHEWAVTASALFLLKPDDKIIFGDRVADGQPLRLLQMFVGLPWVSTYSAARSNRMAVEARLGQAKSDAQRIAGRSKARQEELEERERQVTAALAGLPDRAALRRELAGLDAQLASIQGDATAALEAVATAEAEAKAAAGALVERRRLLRQVEDEAGAGYLFRKLRPVCCPACEAGIDARRYEAAPGPTCTLCGREEVSGNDEADERIAALRRDVEEAGRTAASLRRKVDSARTGHEAILDHRRGIAERIEVVRQRLLAEDEASTLERELIGVQARLEELRTVAPADGDSDLALDLAVLQAAEAESKLAFEGLQRSLLGKLAALMLEYAAAFGVPNLASMEFDQGGRLKIRQGNASVYFGDLAPGERLRVRVAAALAVVNVGRETGYGRHPGLLVLDSPGAQEMVTVDLETMLAALTETVSATEGFQVIIGAVARPEFAVVPSAHRKQVHGDAYLF